VGWGGGGGSGTSAEENNQGKKKGGGGGSDNVCTLSEGVVAAREKCGALVLGQRDVREVSREGRVYSLLLEGGAAQDGSKPTKNGGEWVVAKRTRRKVGA